MQKRRRIAPKTRMISIEKSLIILQFEVFEGGALQHFDQAFSPQSFLLFRQKIPKCVFFCFE